MRCQICNTFCDNDIAEYNEVTGKMDFICGSCDVEHFELMQEYQEEEEGEVGEDV